jgi:hypothetical protein
MLRLELIHARQLAEKRDYALISWLADNGIINRDEGLNLIRNVQRTFGHLEGAGMEIDTGGTHQWEFRRHRGSVPEDGAIDLMGAFSAWRDFKFLS